MQKRTLAIFLALCLYILAGPSCSHTFDEPIYQTKYVVIIVVDGPRYSETWDEANRRYIPERSKLASSGVLLSNFQNNGETYTNQGHTAISTGNYESISNFGGIYPENPSIFQYYLKQTKLPRSKCQLITSKDKLYILSDCNDTSWAGKYCPESDCGISGHFSGYREDNVTYARVIKTMNLKHPNLVLVNFKEPDQSGHAGNWQSYLDGIRSTDYYIGLIWKYLQTDIYYKGKTTLIVSNDHGRHLDGVADGYISHGDACDGCRHIEFFGIGPDFKQGYTSNKSHEQIDICSTVGELLGFKPTASKGKVIKEIFN